jgi:diguanylate cyclase
VEFPHSFEQALDYCQHALALMRAHAIPPHPHNFLVCYAYASGQSQPIGQAINALVNSGAQITEERIAELHANLNGSSANGEALYPLMAMLEQELTSAVAVLERAGLGAKEYGEVLEGAAGDVAQLTSGFDEAVRRLVGRLLAKTRAMGQQSREIERQLLVSWSKVGKLSVELEEAKRDAETDPLTGLGNRKLFDRALRAAAIEALDAEIPLSLLLIDVDHFKSFNDQFGHVMGDQILKLIAVILRENIRGQDTATRYGGEEFAVILPKTTARDGCKVADNIRIAIGDKKLINRKTGDRLRQVTVSIGVAGFVATDPLPKLIAAADRALYFAKQLGRNRVINHADVHGPAAADASSKPAAGETIPSPAERA